MLTSCTDGPLQTAPSACRKPLGRLDLDALQRLPQICSMDVMLIDGDDPRATLGTLRQAASVACTLEHDVALRCRFGVPAGYLLLGYVHHAGRNSWSRACTLQSGSALALAAGMEADFMFGAGTRTTLLLIQTALPHAGGEPEIFQTVASGGPAALAKTYQQLRWNILLRSDPAYAAVDAPVDLGKVLENHASALFHAPAHHGELPSRQRHYQVVQQVEKYLLAHLAEDIYLGQMCRVAKVSERCLRYAFDDLLGISPVRFLGMLRLCAASRSLAQADARRRSVKSIAMDCGLRDLSRFADNYRRVFGELPHDTLLRPPQHAGTSVRQVDSGPRGAR